MCGIVGLFLKKSALEPELGHHMSAMLATMCERGPDSAGFAVYGDPSPGRTKLTVRIDDTAIDPRQLAATVSKALGNTVGAEPRGSHAVFDVPAAHELRAIAAIEAAEPEITIVGRGRRMELYKDVGRPDAVADRFGLSRMAGSHGIGHTRMATESAVTTAGAHPFSTGPDQCLVHNGSLSNHNALRRTLQHHGMNFETDNDSEVAAAYLTWRMGEGASLGEALTKSLDDLDGFYTFVVGTETGFGVLRDRVACKPAVMAETDDWVAFGSEYRVLAGLPGISAAKVWEPEPATVYFWERAR